jgi:hypothetical protein
MACLPTDTAAGTLLGVRTHQTVQICLQESNVQRLHTITLGVLHCWQDAGVPLLHQRLIFGGKVLQAAASWFMLSLMA